MSHTPTPWQARWGSIRHAGQRDTLSRCVIGTPKNKNGGSFVVCAIEGPFAGNEAQAKANARFIVEACNAHEQFKIALRGIATGTKSKEICIGLAKQALALCEEGGKG